MSKKRIAQYCCAALVAAGVGLNIQNAIADYGIAENSLSLVAVGGSNSGSNSNSNSNSNTNTGGGDNILENHKLKRGLKPLNTGGFLITRCCKKKEGKNCDKRDQEGPCKSNE